MTAMYKAWRKVTEGPPIRRYPVVLMTIRPSRRDIASRSRLRRAMALSPPFVDQIRHQSAPAGLVAGAQSHSTIAVVILVEEQALVPVRVFLKFLVEAETGPLAVSAAFENGNHAVGRFPRDFMRRDWLIVAAGGGQ